MKEKESTTRLSIVQEHVVKSLVSHSPAEGSKSWQQRPGQDVMMLAYCDAAARLELLHHFPVELEP